MNIWMIEKNLMEYHYLKKEDFYSNLNTEDNSMQIMSTQKEFVKNLK